MLRRYVEQIFNIFNYVDGIIVTDENAIIQYYKNLRPDLNNMSEQDVLGKHVLDVYVSLTEETSSIFRVLKDGNPINNEYQVFTNFKGQEVCAVNTTLPIFDKGKIIGTVDVSSYERQGIELSINSNDKDKLYNLDDIVTKSPEMLSIKEKILRTANTDSAVLIYGETGTGKELVAQSIYTSGNRKNKKFISQNCAAIPSTLLESILFGTVKGSFTDAKSRPGLFEIANGGVLFLDEINSMELNIQPKLLKAIEDKRITRVGDTKPIDIDLKIVSAVNEDPLKCIRDNKLREDLFYRLSVVQISIPPLRNRPEDLEYLIKYFIKIFNEDMNAAILGIDEEVEKIFKNYSWPGNVRELKNIIEGAFNLTSSRFIQKKDLPSYIIDQIRISPALSSLNNNLPLKDMVEQFERTIIEKTLEKSPSYAEAANKLKLSRQALHYKLKKYSL